MAKGNLFLGMGRGSVGDVTFYRADGQQLSRARNRKPRNPKSNAQQIQRAISATIVQAYKAGSMIFDHSFEGKSVPSGSQRAFLSTNMRKLREMVLSEIDKSPISSTISAVVSPRSVYPVPNPYRISEGSLIQNLFEISQDTTAESPTLGAKMVEGLANETIAAYLQRLGIEAGDIFTICVFGVNQGNRTTDLVNGQCVFGFMRLTVKSTAVNLTTPIAQATYGQLFDVDSSGAGLDLSRAITAPIDIYEINLAGSYGGSMGVIRSNTNSGLRSTCDMVTICEAGEDDNNWGVAPGNLLAAWSQESGSVDSELILEGGAI